MESMVDGSVMEVMPVQFLKAVPSMAVTVYSLAPRVTVAGMTMSPLRVSSLPSCSATMAAVSEMTW